MEAELAELLKRATAAYAKHGDSRVYFVVHEVGANNRIVDHNESPEGCVKQSHGSGLIHVDGRHLSSSIWRPMDTDVAMKSWLEVAQACGAWCLPRRMLTLTPLPTAAALWGIELFSLPKSVRQYQRSMWFCNAFGANVVMLRLLAAGNVTELTISGTGKQAEREVVAADHSESALPAIAKASGALSYQDPDNYQRNVWLYELRKSGMTIAAIRAALNERATEFSTLESENALRTAIESIAMHHGWPLLLGKPGRPKISKRDSDG